MAAQITAYQGVVARPDKFCHAFGIFQLDLQFFRTDPQYFLAKRYADFDAMLGKCIGELKSVLKRLGWETKTALTDLEMAAIAIAYNTGRYDPAKGLEQGYFDGTKYYGENFFAFLQLVHGVPSAPMPATRGLPAQAAAARETVPKKTVPKKAVAKKTAAKKAGATTKVGKKAVAKKAAAKKPAAKKAVAKKKTVSSRSSRSRP